MSTNGTPFKTPYPFTPKKLDYDHPNKKLHPTSSDSDESTAGTSEGIESDSSNDISIVAEFDDYIRLIKKLRRNKTDTDVFLGDMAEQMKQIIVNGRQAIDECKRLHEVLENKMQDCADLENKLAKARKLLDREKNNIRSIKKERDELILQIAQVQQLIANERNGNVGMPPPPQSTQRWDGQPMTGVELSAIKEVNSTGSILSDFSFSRSEEDLDESLSQLNNRGIWKKHKSSGYPIEPALKKRKSSTSKAVEINSTDTVRATTTVTVEKDGPIKATSIIESVPKTPTPLAPPPPSSTTDSPALSHAPPSHLIFESWARGSPAEIERHDNVRQHVFQQRTVVLPDMCSICDKRIRFGKVAVKCKDCRANCHLECKDRLALPCIPLPCTPNQRNGVGNIGDYTSTTPPMVPALLVHCINEIELRGLGEIGIYRIPGAEKDVKALKEKFLKGKGAPCLDDVDIHVICGCVKDFLRSLSEPIVTYRLWRDFVRVIETKDSSDIDALLREVVGRLPQPNRDTLAYIVVHLQKISQSKECKMPIGNLSKVFGPTVVGYSSDDVNPDCILTETAQQVMVMEHLMRLPNDYWSSFINISSLQPPSKLQQTPSTDSLLRTATTRNFFTPNRNMIKKKQKYFSTVPMDH